MADTQIHEQQAKHNYLFLKSFIGKSDFRDWQVTVSFYTALHITECQLNKLNPKWRESLIELDHRGIHAWQETCISKAFRDIYGSYRLLHEKSETARYLRGSAGNKIAKDILTKSDVKELIEIHLKKIIDKFGYNW